MNCRTLVQPIVCSAVLLLLALIVMSTWSANSNAQGYGAQQAVRQRVQGIGTPDAPEHEFAEQPQPGGYYESGPIPSGISGALDTTSITPGAIGVVVVRPAQILATPFAEVLPTEVAVALSTMYLGVDPAQIDEFILVVDQSNPLAPAWTAKFNQPYRGASIPSERRVHTQLGELAGRKYLQSAHPMLPSFYGLDNKTLVVGPDAAVRQIAESAGQPKTGRLVEFAQSASAGNDLYVAIDLAALQPIVQMSLPQMQDQIPDEAKPALEILKLLSAIELTLNLSVDGPTSLVLHAADDTAASQLEMLIQAANSQQQEQMRSERGMQPMPAHPILQAISRYEDRLANRWVELTRPQRDGNRIILFRAENPTATQKQILESAVAALIGAARSQMQPPMPTAPGSEFSEEELDH